MDAHPVAGPLMQQAQLTRWGHLDDICNMATYLLSEESGFVTGTELRIDGRVDLHGPHPEPGRHGLRAAGCAGRRSRAGMSSRRTLGWGVGISAGSPRASMHLESERGVTWTTRNFGEAIPGVQTPLGLTFCVDTSEVTLVQTTADIGAVSSREAKPSAVVSQRFMGQFYGRMAGNINRFRDLAERMPGSSGDAFEEQIFGKVRSGEKNHPRRRCYPITAVKMPYRPWRASRRNAVTAP